MKRFFLVAVGPAAIGTFVLTGLLTLLIGLVALTLTMSSADSQTDDGAPVSSHCTPGASPNNIPEEYQDDVAWAASESGLSQELLAAQLDNESGWDPDASSGVAHGLAQFTDETWPGYGEGNIWDPHESIRAQGRYMKTLMDMYEDEAADEAEQVKLALAAYNAGPGNVDQYGGVPPFQETQDYVVDIPAAAQGNYVEDCAQPDTGGQQVGDVGSGDWTHPLPGGDFSSGFGSRPCPAGATCNEFTTQHGGVDFSSGGGNEVVAVTDMQITAVSTNKFQGHHIIARQDNPDKGDGYVFQFHHCEPDSAQVAVGDTVAVGEPICTEGSTGNATGPHVHFQIGTPDQDDSKPDQIHDYAIDPEPILIEAGVDF